MQDLEEAQAKLELYLTAIGDTESLKKYGRIGNGIDKMNDFEALMKCSLERGLINQEQYLDFLQSEKECEEYNDENEC